MFELEKSVKTLPEMNGDLLTVTNKISQYHQNVKNSILAISLILAEVAEKPNDYFYGSGFTTIAEYAENLFSYKKAYTYKLIKISKFVTLRQKNGRKLSVEYLLNDTMMDKLLEEGDSVHFDVLCDSDGFEYSTSQMLELIPLTSEQINEHLNELDSSLSCKELRAVVKNIINPPVDVVATVSDGEENTDAETDTTSEIQLTDKDRILKMLEISAGLENERIKENIVNVFQKSLKALEN